MKYEQISYSIFRLNVHWQNIQKELELLSHFLQANNVKIISAIDMGCGCGSITVKLRELLGIDIIYGLDLNKGLLKKAKRKGIAVICGDMSSVNFKLKFDLVISYGSLHHSENTPMLITNLKRMSNKYLLIIDNTVRNNFFHKLTGSKYFIFEPSPYKIRCQEEIIEALNQVGCSVIAVKTNVNANFWHDRSFFLSTI
jgi:2-polyprenyl-3-methyl-5-hydroxy-6-metoxy-1,4-benzoquinol methylase